MMRASSVLFAVILLTLVSGCSTVAEKDLADLQSPNAIVRKEAIDRISGGPGFPVSQMGWLVSRTNEKRAVKLMVALLQKGEEAKEVQLSILKALGELGRRTETAIPPLVERLKDEDPDCRREATEALGKTRNKKALAPLVKLLDEEKDAYTVLWALGEIGDERAIPTLNAFLASDDQYLRYNAYRALAKIGRPDSDGDVDEKRGVLDFGKKAFKKYQDAMIIVFRKIAHLNNA
jgi:HEAT repeat protein